MRSGQLLDSEIEVGLCSVVELTGPGVGTLPPAVETLPADGFVFAIARTAADMKLWRIRRE